MRYPAVLIILLIQYNMMFGNFNKKTKINFIFIILLQKTFSVENNINYLPVRTSKFGNYIV